MKIVFLTGFYGTFSKVLEKLSLKLYLGEFFKIQIVGLKSI